MNFLTKIDVEFFMHCYCECPQSTDLFKASSFVSNLLNLQVCIKSRGLMVFFAKKNVRNFLSFSHFFDKNDSIFAYSNVLKF